MNSGIVCVYGKANAGKSSLINRILGFKLLPISDKPQTTRDSVKAIYNDSESQIVFIDTPGIFKPHKRFGEILLRNAENAKHGADIILYVVDLTTNLDIDLTKKLIGVKEKIIVIFNKIDLVKYENASIIIKRVKELLPNSDFIEISCLGNINIDVVLNTIKKYLPYKEKLFNDNIVLDRPKEYIISEMIREKCMRLLKKELPHSIYVQFDHMNEDENSLEVFATIIVEKNGEKGIIIGKSGKMIKEIS